MANSCFQHIERHQLPLLQLALGAKLQSCESISDIVVFNVWLDLENQKALVTDPRNDSHLFLSKLVRVSADLTK
jgi:hypothetical protein